MTVSQRPLHMTFGSSSLADDCFQIISSMDLDDDDLAHPLCAEYAFCEW